jgi:hypothetical protein
MRTMTSKTVKRIIIGTAIAVATAIPVFGKNDKTISKATEPKAYYFSFSQGDPLIKVDTPYRLHPLEKRIIERMDDMAIRYAENHKNDPHAWKRITDAYLSKDFRMERDIVRLYAKRARPPSYSYEQFRKDYELDEKKIYVAKYYESRKQKIDQVAAEFNFDYRQILSTLGMEINFERYPIKYKAFNAIVAMYASDTKKEFAYDQLEAYLSFCDERKEDIFLYDSSSAAAISQAQIIPQNLKATFGTKMNPLNFEDSLRAICKFHLLNGWNPKKNHLIPTKGSRNWDVLMDYNPWSFYVMGRNEIASCLPPDRTVVSTVDIGAGK